MTRLLGLQRLFDGDMNTPLLLSIELSNHQAIWTLLQHPSVGHIVSSCNVTGHAPLHLAAKYGMVDVVDVL